MNRNAQQWHSLGAQIACSWCEKKIWKSRSTNLSENCCKRIMEQKHEVTLLQCYWWSRWASTHQGRGNCNAKPASGSCFANNLIKQLPRTLAWCQRHAVVVKHPPNRRGNHGSWDSLLCKDLLRILGWWTVGMICVSMGGMGGRYGRHGWYGW